MAIRSLRLRNWVDRHLPLGTSARKVVEILSVVLIVEGISVLFLFSYVGLFIGLASLFLGSFTLLLLRRKDEVVLSEIDSPGVRFVDYLFHLMGGEYVMMGLGALVIASVLVYNRLVSLNPDLGDSDSLSIMFGATLMLYPLVSNRFRIEATFALIFIGLVVAMLVLPRVLMSFFSGGETLPAGDWYVHYMLAAPFSAILDIIGIPSSSAGNLVTIQFQDGSTHVLSISAYCAGLYSFSIFLSAFASFVLVFESLSRRVLCLALAAGLCVAYIGNLLRMVVIGAVGYYHGIEALHWTHENAGWAIFLGWSSVFWWLILGYVSRSHFRNADKPIEMP